MAILYVIGNEILNPIVESQVFRPLAAEAVAGEAFVIALLPIGLLLRPEQRSNVQRTVARLQQRYGVHVFTSYARLSHYSLPWVDAFAVRRVMRRLARQFKRLEVRCRNAQSSATAIAAARPLIPRPVITYDCRGDELSELLGKAGSKMAAVKSASTQIDRASRRIRKQMEAACGADRIIVVSRAMGRMLQERHGAELAKMTVRQCAVDLTVFPTPNPDEARRAIGLTGRFVVCYLGSLEWYQLPEQSIRVFKLIHAKVPDAFFMAVTTAPDKMQSMLEAEGVSPADFLVVKASPSEVSVYVSAAHVGYLLREDNPVNAVASPVKFAEYLACGVPLLITPHVGDYSALVSEERLGHQIDLAASDSTLSDSLVEAVNSLRQDREMNRRCRLYAEQHLAWRPNFGQAFNA